MGRGTLSAGGRRRSSRREGGELPGLRGGLLRGMQPDRGFARVRGETMGLAPPSAARMGLDAAVWGLGGGWLGLGVVLRGFSEGEGVVRCTGAAMLM